MEKDPFINYGNLQGNDKLQYLREGEGQNEGSGKKQLDGEKGVDFGYERLSDLFIGKTAPIPPIFRVLGHAGLPGG